MNKSILKDLFLRNWKIAVIIALLIALCSCSSRKVQKSETKVNETEQTQKAKIDTSKTVTKTETNTKVLDSSTTDEITIEPVDPSKEMLVDGKSYFNTVIKRKKSKDNKVVDKTETIAKTEQKAVIETDNSKKTKAVVIETKQTERKSSYWWLLWFLLLIPIYYFYRKYRVRL